MTEQRRERGNVDPWGYSLLLLTRIAGNIYVLLNALLVPWNNPALFGLAFNGVWPDTGLTARTDGAVFRFEVSGK